MRSGGCADDEPWRPLIAGNFRAFMAAKNSPWHREGEGSVVPIVPVWTMAEQCWSISIDRGRDASDRAAWAALVAALVAVAGSGASGASGASSGHLDALCPLWPLWQRWQKNGRRW